MSTVEITGETLEATVRDNPIVVLDFWASWCGPCRAFAPIFEAASESHADIVFGKVDTDKNQAMAAELGIQGIPTLMVFREGVLLFNQAGMLRAPDFEDLLTQVKTLDMADVHKKIAEEQSGGDAPEA